MEKTPPEILYVIGTQVNVQKSKPYRYNKVSIFDWNQT